MRSGPARVRGVCAAAALWATAAGALAQDAPVTVSDAPPPAQDASSATVPAEESAPDASQVPPPVALPVPVAPPPPAAPPSEPYVEPRATPSSGASKPPASGGALADTGEEPDGDDAEAEGEKLAWRGTSLSWDHTITKNTLYRPAQRFYNPTYVQTVSIRPRWYFSDTLSLRLRQDMAVELTESDSATEKQQLLFDDTRLDLVESKLAEWQEIVLRVGVTLRLPLSLTSQAEERIAGVGPTVGLSRDFDVLEGLTLDLSGGYRHNFGLSTVKHTDRPFPCKRLADCDQAGGVTNVRETFGANLDASLAFVEKLSFTLGAGGAWSLGYAPTEVDGLADAPTEWRNSVDFHASLSYGPWKWLGIDLGMATITSHEDLFPSGRDGRNPFWHPDTTLSLTLTLGIDELYLASGGEPTATAAAHAGSLAANVTPPGT